MKILDLLENLNNLFGLYYSLEGDKVGLQIGSPSDKVSNVLCAMEITPSVIEEAINKKTNLIIVFHPFVYRPLQTVGTGDIISEMAYTLIRNGISVYSVHTALDTHPKGNNYYLANKLGLYNSKFLDLPFEEAERGMGIMGLIEPTPYHKVLQLISENLSSNLRYSDMPRSKSISKIGLVCGSGIDYAKKAMENDCDLFITADVSYHFFRGWGGMAIVDPGHWEMERWAPQLMLEILTNSNSFNNLTIFVSEIETNFAKQFLKTTKL
ncbi:MAG: Nif3-like dinuclear metal center hexameric protein [Candidatus Kapaibacteriales bacterium]